MSLLQRPANHAEQCPDRPVRRHRCEACNIGYVSKASLKKHNYNVHGVGRDEAEIQRREKVLTRYPTRETTYVFHFFKHFRIVRLHYCRKCGKAVEFGWKGVKLKNHERTCTHGEVSIPCEHCDAPVFPNKKHVCQFPRVAGLQTKRNLLTKLKMVTEYREACDRSDSQKQLYLTKVGSSRVTEKLLLRWENELDLQLEFISYDLIQNEDGDFRPKWKTQKIGDTSRSHIKWKDLMGCSVGSGGTQERVITPAMEKCIMECVAASRGLPPEAHILNSKFVELAFNGQYIDLRYPDIIDRLLTDFNELEELPYKTLYSRVWRWCDANNISYRTPNKSVKPDEEMTDRRCLGTLKEMETKWEQDKLEVEDLVSIDETGLRPLLIHMRTLHYRGANDVPVANELTSHVMLSLLVGWFGSGKINFVGITGTNKFTKWETHSGISFLHTLGSKMTSKDTYTELLEVLLQGENPKSSSDDIYGGHGGTNPDNSLKQRAVPCSRVRVQGNCTADLATADQGQANKALKALLRRKLRANHFNALLKGDNIIFEGTSLTPEGLKTLGRILSEVKAEWNSSIERREGVKRAFVQTLVPGPLAAKSHRLRERLERCERKQLTPVYAPYSSNPNAEEECEYGCGHTFMLLADKKKHLADPKNCWPRRGTLKPPLTPQQEPGGSPEGLLFKLDGNTCVLVDHDQGFKLSPLQPLPRQFWQNTTVKYLHPQLLENKPIYAKLNRLIQEAVNSYKNRKELSPPFKDDELLFVMDNKMYFTRSGTTWLLPQVQGKQNPDKMEDKFWLNKSLKYFSKVDHDKHYNSKLWNDKIKKCTDSSAPPLPQESPPLRPTDWSKTPPPPPPTRKRPRTDMSRSKRKRRKE